jgi:anti-sigma regulatory factor (Ser/Thr protein kinase)
VQVEGKKSRSIRLSIDPGAEYRDVLSAFDSIDLPQTALSAENLRFAVLELVNNSLRAHRERGVQKEIVIDIYNADSNLIILIRDFGGGFDPARLPYPMDADARAVDIMGEPFLEYQKRNDFRRFGMGLLIAKKTFDRFRLLFLDGKGSPAPWDPGNTAGTLIRLEIASGPGNADGKEGDGGR